ncbi:uncharacterized protein [Ptychodera flava]|uniref:uncharacterized protein n=1 Tax=Ptychodera flava TaxID=63121 RepID=UPI00396A941A
MAVIAHDRVDEFQTHRSEIFCKLLETTPYHTIHGILVHWNRFQCRKQKDEKLKRVNSISLFRSGILCPGKKLKYRYLTYFSGRDHIRYLTYSWTQGNTCICLALKS